MTHNSLKRLMTKNISYLFFILLLSVFCCTNVKTERKIYTDRIGDIPFLSEIDDPAFLLCDSTQILHSRGALKYANKSFTSDVKRMYEFKSQYKNFSGYVVIRFIINCDNTMGRFRAEPLDYDFMSIECPPDLKNHLISIVKELSNWKHTSDKFKSSDCSKYINFKISNGQIESILQ
jgi:hypothetical protein